ncbi:acetyltransferase [Colletotrichum scovillei]|uniref:Acetyltransferase n=1 Tax=Colletotrichum scovillei TaxID=1209932 RepID=A0A9P7R304_9PEZI|nr:acetyltransferase [Colletotrichum scovillei]KAF4776594.1 acetyltransferase [Colletotrichum scovillei]KAG7047832.1 acetyltransferase [Colletotrichum scovillei]KAG7060152.1 acetyltransferase [Colletotrichum scovillei]KAG7067599.1 acetyltransferase [Colletotrichum scovillei]
MGLTVLPALIPDIPQVYDAYFAAFKGSVILDILFPTGIDEAFREGHTKHTVEYWHKTSTQYTIKCVNVETGEVVGMALWDAFLKERTPEEYRSPGAVWLQGEQRARADELINPLSAAKEKLWAGRKYVYCHIIAVKPEHQRKGVGALLTKWGLDMAELAGLPVYLESSEEGFGLYKRLGFEVLQDKIVHRGGLVGKDKDVEVPLMVKMPSAAKGLTFEEWRAQGYPSFQ